MYVAEGADDVARFRETPGSGCVRATCQSEVADFRVVCGIEQYWFLGAVLLSIVNAILTKRLVQSTVRDSERDNSGQLNS